MPQATKNPEIAEAIQRVIDEREAELQQLKNAKREVTGKKKPGRKPGFELYGSRN